jgi:two-component system response regulator RpaA
VPNSSKILVIEDDTPLRKVLVAKLKESDYPVESAADGEEGLALALQLHPDLILLDLILPKKDGREVLHQLRADSWGRNVPVIILTVLDADEKMLNEILAYHPAHYFIKSEWRLEDVIEKVKELLEVS